MTTALDSHPPLRPVHPFPARMAPAIVWEELSGLSTGDPLRVLDPMAGSGTTIATSRLLGHDARGFDTDPLAVLIAQAWSADVDREALEEKAAIVAERASRCAHDLTISEAYPVGADEETKAFVRYWFDETARRQLAGLARTIARVQDEETRSLLWCSFSRLIIVKCSGASRAMDVAHSRPHRVYDKAPIRPLDHFHKAAHVVARNSPFADGVRRTGVKVRQGDARKLPIADAQIDLVITSPPYLNAIDYLRGHKFSLIWMGHTIEALRAIRAGNVGTEVGERHEQDAEHLKAALAAMTSEETTTRIAAMLRRYAVDMDAVIREIARVLRPKGRAVLVVGDSTLKGRFVANSKGLEVLGEKAGLKLTKARKRPLPSNRRYLPPPESSRSGVQLVTRMKEEVILTFEKL